MLRLRTGIGKISVLDRKVSDKIPSTSTTYNMLDTMSLQNATNVEELLDIKSRKVGHFILAKFVHFIGIKGK